MAAPVIITCLLSHLQLDRQDAQERAEARRIQIERANKMLADDTDRVKTLHGRLLLAETLAENAALVAYKQSRKQMEEAQKAAFVQQQRQVGGGGRARIPVTAVAANY